MAAAKITSTSTMVAYPWKLATFAKVTQSDWTILDCAGTLAFDARDVTGAVETPTYADVDAVHATAYGTTDTAIVYDGATANARSAGGFYIRNSTGGEIMYVVADSAPAAAGGTFTVRRGCLGTTPAAIANNAVLVILNTIIFGSATTGPATITYLPLPDDPATQIIG